MKIFTKILTNDNTIIRTLNDDDYTISDTQFLIQTQDYLKEKLLYQTGSFDVTYYFVQNQTQDYPIFEESLKILKISRDLTQIKCKFVGDDIPIERLQALESKMDVDDVKLLASNQTSLHSISYLKYNFFTDICVIRFQQPISYKKGQQMSLYFLEYQPLEQKIDIFPEEIDIFPEEIEVIIQYPQIPKQPKVEQPEVEQEEPEEQYVDPYTYIRQPNIYTTGNMESSEIYNLNQLLIANGGSSDVYNPMVSIGNMLQTVHYDPYYPQNFVHFGSYKVRIDVFVNKYIDISEMRNDFRSGISFTNSIKNIIQGFNTFERHCFLDYGLVQYDSENIYTIIGMEPFQGDFFKNWYSTKSANAIQYDRDNIHALTNFIPDTILYDDRNVDLFAMVNMIGNTFDEYWSTIRAIPSINGRLQGQLQMYSQKLLNDLLKNYGVDYRMGYANQGISKTYMNFWSPTSASLTVNQYDKIVKSRLVSNMPFLLRSKGTRLAIEQILMSYGLSENIIGIDQYNNDYIFKFKQHEDKFYKLRDSNSMVFQGENYFENRYDLYNYPQVLIGQYYSKGINQSISSSYSSDSEDYEDQSFESLLDNNEYQTEFQSKNKFYSYDHRQMEKYKLENRDNFSKSNVEQLIQLHQGLDTSVYHTIKQFVPNSVNVKYKLVIDNHILARNKIPTIDFINKYQDIVLIKTKKISPQVDFRCRNYDISVANIDTSDGIKFNHQVYNSVDFKINSNDNLRQVKLNVNGGVLGAYRRELQYGTNLKKNSCLNNCVYGNYRYGLMDSYSWSNSVWTHYIRREYYTASDLNPTYMPTMFVMGTGQLVNTGSKIYERKMIVDTDRLELSTFGTKVKI